MKHKITVLLSLIIVVLAGALVVSAHDNYVHDQAVRASYARAKANLDARVSAAQKASNAFKLQALKDRCASDHADYLAKTPAQRVATKATDCDPSLQLVQ